MDKADKRDLVNDIKLFAKGVWPAATVSGLKQLQDLRDRVDQYRKDVINHNEFDNAFLLTAYTYSIDEKADTYKPVIKAASKLSPKVQASLNEQAQYFCRDISLLLFKIEEFLIDDCFRIKKPDYPNLEIRDTVLYQLERVRPNGEITRRKIIGEYNPETGEAALVTERGLKLISHKDYTRPRPVYKEKDEAEMTEYLERSCNLFRNFYNLILSYNRIFDQIPLLDEIEHAIAAARQVLRKKDTLQAFRLSVIRKNIFKFYDEVHTNKYKSDFASLYEDICDELIDVCVDAEAFLIKEVFQADTSYDLTIDNYILYLEEFIHPEDRFRKEPDNLIPVARYNLKKRRVEWEKPQYKLEDNPEEIEDAAEYISLTLAEKLYDTFNNRQFTISSAEALHHYLNLAPGAEPIKIKNQQKLRVCHFIRQLAVLRVDDDHRLRWEEQILEPLPIDKAKLYDKKHTLDKNASKANAEFIEKLDAILHTVK